MNKKLSLMMAALIAAGYSVTAEAGIVKVAAPAANAKYVIAVDNFTLEGSELALTTDGGFAGKDINAVTNAELWTLSTTSGGTVKNVATGTSIQADGSLGQTAETFTGVNPLVKGSSSGDFFKVAATPAWGDTPGTAYTYAVTTPIHAATASGKKVYVKKGELYAVNTTGTTVVYLDGATIAMLGLDAKAQFSVDASGAIYNDANEISAVAADGTITLVAETNRANIVEKDLYNSDNKVYVTVTAGTTTATDGGEHFSVVDALSTPLVPAGALAWTNGTTGVLYVNPAGDITTAGAVKEIQAAGTVATTGTTNAALTLKLNSDGSYSLFNGVEQIKLADKVSFSIEKIAGTNGFTLKSENEVLTINNTTLTWKVTDGNASVSTGDAVAVFSFSKGTPSPITADALSAIENGGITLTASYGNGKTDIKGNPFVGFLTVEKPETPATVNDFYLKSGNKYIVGRPGLIQGADNVAYGFTTVEKLTDMKQGDLAIFTAQTYAGETTPSEILLSLTNAGVVGYYEVPDGAYMGAGSDPKKVTLSLGTGTLAKWQDVLQKDKFFTVEKIKDYSTDNAKAEGYLVATGTTATAYAYSKTVRNVLEGEWALTLNVAKDKYVLTNRETPEVTFEFIGVNSLYTTTSEYTYVSGKDKYIITPVA
ncbi:hypothetical protein, partial [Parabacteroides sp.]